MQTLARTPLHDRHVALGAKMVPFAGWEMPVQYEGVLAEHRAVRSDAGVFDVSHMGEIEGATGILLNISGGPDVGLFEVNEAAEVVTSAADQNANVIFGAVIDEALKDEVRVTVIATGFGPSAYRRRRRAAVPEEERREERQPEEKERFEVTDDVLEVPSFLRE